ncbi:MAG: hypothetical protein QXS68_02990 [Candidatus Methanomethylicaceae archaeon]
MNRNAIFRHEEEAVEHVLAFFETLDDTAQLFPMYPPPKNVLDIVAHVIRLYNMLPDAEKFSVTFKTFPRAQGGGWLFLFESQDVELVLSARDGEISAAFRD